MRLLLRSNIAKVGQHSAEQQLEPRTMRQNLGSGHGRKGLGCRMRVGGDCGGLLRWAASPASLGGESRVGLVGSRQPGSSEETGNFKMSKNIISSRLAAPRFSRNRLLKPSFCQMIRFCSHIGPNPSGWKVCFSGGEKFPPLVASSPRDTAAGQLPIYDYDKPVYGIGYIARVYYSRGFYIVYFPRA